MDLKDVLPGPDRRSLLELGVVASHGIEVNLVIAHVFGQVVGGFELSRHVITHKSWIIFLKHTLVTISNSAFKLLVKRLKVELILRLIRSAIKHGSAEHQLTIFVKHLVSKLLIRSLLLFIIVIVLELACDEHTNLRQVPDFILWQRQRRIILEFLLVPLDLGIILCLLGSIHSPLFLI